MKRRDYKLNIYESHKIQVRTMLFMLFVVVIVYHNVFVVSKINFPIPSIDARLSSICIQNEKNLELQSDMYNRMTKESLVPEFLSICSFLYSGKTLITSGEMFKKELLLEAGFKSVKTVEGISINEINEHDLLIKSSKSLWYSPLVFSPSDYKILVRFPLKTEPPMVKKYPYVILFIKAKDSNEEILVKQIGRYVVFYPQNMGNLK